MEGQSLSAKSRLVWIIARDCQFSDFLVFFSRKENKGEVVFENLLKNPHTFQAAVGLVKTARIWQF